MYLPSWFTHLHLPAYFLPKLTACLQWRLLATDRVLPPIPTVEHLTTFRQLEVRDFGLVVTQQNTGFEALYAYKRGDYRQCLQMSIQNIRS